MPYIDIRFHFDAEEIPDEDFTDYSLKSVSLLNSDISKDNRYGIAESWAQSDKFFITTTRDIISAVDGEV